MDIKTERMNLKTGKDNLENSENMEDSLEENIRVLLKEVNLRTWRKACEAMRDIFCEAISDDKSDEEIYPYVKYFAVELVNAAATHGKIENYQRDLLLATRGLLVGYDYGFKTVTERRKKFWKLQGKYYDDKRKWDINTKEMKKSNLDGSSQKYENKARECVISWINSEAGKNWFYDFVLDEMPEVWSLPSPFGEVYDLRVYSTTQKLQEENLLEQIDKEALPSVMIATRLSEIAAQNHSQGQDSCNFWLPDFQFEPERYFAPRDSMTKEIYSNLRFVPNCFFPYIIYGPPGSGKTILAKQYAYRYVANYDRIVWLDCNTKEDIEVLFGDSEYNIRNITGELVKYSRWLLILNDVKYWPQKYGFLEDLVQELREYAFNQCAKGSEPSCGHILIISRKKIDSFCETTFCLELSDDDLKRTLLTLDWTPVRFGGSKFRSSLDLFDMSIIPTHYPLVFYILIRWIEKHEKDEILQKVNELNSNPYDDPRYLEQMAEETGIAYSDEIVSGWLQDLKYDSEYLFDYFNFIPYLPADRDNLEFLEKMATLIWPTDSLQKSSQKKIEELERLINRYRVNYNEEHKELYHFFQNSIRWCHKKADDTNFIEILYKAIREYLYRYGTTNFSVIQKNGEAAICIAENAQKDIENMVEPYDLAMIYIFYGLPSYSDKSSMSFSANDDQLESASSAEYFFRGLNLLLGLDFFFAEKGKACILAGEICLKEKDEKRADEFRKRAAELGIDREKVLANDDIYKHALDVLIIRRSIDKLNNI